MEIADSRLTRRSVKRAYGGAILLGVAASALALPAAAQTAADALAPGAGGLIIDQQRQDRQLAAPPPTLTRPLVAQPAPTIDAATAPAPATPLRELRIIGAQRLSAQVQATAASFAGRPLDAATVRAAADAISKLYADEGLALYTVSAPRQNLNGGVLILQVIEGYIGEVEIAGEAASNRLVRAYAEKIRAEKPLTKRAMERYLSLIRDIPGMTVDAQLFNGTAPGSVRLKLTVTEKRFVPEVAFNNRGTPRLGSVQIQAAMTANHLLRAGDQARVTASAPTDFERYRFAGLSYATPVGADGLVLQGNLSYLRTQPDNPPIQGKAVSAGVQASYPVIRGYTKNLYVSGGFDGLNSDNALYGFTFTSDHTRAVRLGGTYSQSSERRSLAFSASAAQGVSILGGRTDARLTDADFRKLTLQASVNQAVGTTVFVRLRAMAQLSDGRLPTAEQLPLGGEAFGRAFYQGTIVGDRGHAGSAELAWAAKNLWPNSMKGSELFTYIDGGAVVVRDRSPFIARQRYDLASAGVGTRLNFRNKLNVGLEFAKAIDRAYPGGGKPWRLLVSWRTSL